MTRKITTILLALALCLTLLPVGAGAVDTPAPSGVELKMVDNTLKYGNNVVATLSKTSTISVKYGNSENAEITIDSGYVLDGGTAGATYTLGADVVTIDKPLIIQGGTADNPVTLNLCGHVLKYENSSNNSVIVVANGAHFTLTDSDSDTNNGYSYTIDNDSDPNAFKLYTPTDTSAPENASKITGGIITGGTGTTTASTFGGGVFVGQNATFSMTGGNIVGCTAGSKGGGVYVSKNTTFTMSGGSIVGCTATEPDSSSSSSGGGVCVVGGTFNMEGSSRIVGCTANGNGGGGVYVSNSGTFNMTDGNIESCSDSSNNGGGVYVSGSSTFTMKGGNIKNCTASSSGGGVYVSDSTFTMEGGNIENCKATENGGSVYVDGSFDASTMDAKGGTIEGCTVTGDGAQGSGVYLDGSSATLINTSGGDGTKFNGDITNNGGNTNKPTKDPADPTEQSREFLGWFVANTTGKGYKQVEFDSDGKTNDTGNILRAFWEGDFEVEVSNAVDGSGYYKSFTEAWNALHGGETATFKLLNNVDIAGGITVEKKGYTIDLNGKKLTAGITISGGTDSGKEKVLTVKDSSNSGGTLDGTVKASAGYATLQVTGGTVNKVEVSDGGKVNCSGGTITTATVNTNGTLECNSGTITTATVNTGGTVKCIGGTITHLDDKGGTVNHTGGTATCTKQAECSVCGTSYGSTNPNNHAGKVLYIPAAKATCKDGGNNVYYQCWDCKNFFKDNNCTEPTTANAERTSKDPTNHAGTLGGYQSDKDGHWQVYSCCNATTAKVAHNFDGSKCSVCGYVKQTSHRTYRSSAPTISAVLSHSGAASATDYTSGIYGLTFRSTASFASFRGVQVDGKTIASTNYIAEEGSIVVYLKAVYLQTLAKGSHTVTILSTEGNTTANFTIGGVQSAKTGDPGVAIYALMALTSYTGTALVVRGRKRK